jgi:dihydroflavonol-4-reductase
LGQRAVVTGGSGHVGVNLVRSLLADGHTVNVVDVRRPVTAMCLGATWTRADVRDERQMRQAFLGAHVVYHLASVISVVGAMRGLVESVNVDGTRTVASAALAAGVPRLVYCGSVHAFDLAHARDEPITEASVRSTGPRLPAYDRSKAAAEAELRRVVDRNLDAVSINPTGVVGPIDEEPSRMGAMFLALWRRRLPAIVAGGFDWVDVRDVVAALRAAAVRGRTGETYLVPGHRLSIRQLVDLAAACSHHARVPRTAPAWAVGACQPAATCLARYTRNPLLPTREALRALTTFPIVDGGKAHRELGHQPRPIQETLGDLYRYFATAGLLNHPAPTDPVTESSSDRRNTRLTHRGTVTAATPSTVWPR